MAKLALGRVGAAAIPTEGQQFLDGVAELEALGYSTIWVTGGPLAHLGQVAEVVRATSTAKVASAILSVDRFPSDDVAALYDDLEASDPGRFVLGLGGAHGPKPLGTLNAYLDRLDAAGVPASRRIMAALGPRMRDLARTRASGVLPVLVTPDYVAEARTELGDDVSLAVQQLAVVETDPDRARAAARQPLAMLGALPAYQASFRRQGFTDDDIDPYSDRIVDAFVPWGDAAAVAGHVEAQLKAGADHVALYLVGADDLDEPTLANWRAVAEQLGLG
jgi:probable F420-dependent oxidoreductase